MQITGRVRADQRAPGGYELTVTDVEPARSLRSTRSLRRSTASTS